MIPVLVRVQRGPVLVDLVAEVAGDGAALHGQPARLAAAAAAVAVRSRSSVLLLLLLLLLLSFSV